MPRGGGRCHRCRPGRPLKSFESYKADFKIFLEKFLKDASSKWEIFPRTPNLHDANPVFNNVTTEEESQQQQPPNDLSADNDLSNKFLVSVLLLGMKEYMNKFFTKNNTTKQELVKSAFSPNLIFTKQRVSTNTSSTSAGFIDMGINIVKDVQSLNSKFEKVTKNIENVASIIEKFQSFYKFNIERNEKMDP